MIAFPSGGALEVPVDEPTWADLVASWEPSPEGVWDPVVPADDADEVAEEVRSAVNLLAGGVLVVEVMASNEGRALATRMTVNGDVLARATRVLHPVDGRIAKVPGVLVGIGTAGQLVGAIAGTLAGLTDDEGWAAEPPAGVSPAVATAVMAALKDGDEEAAQRLLARTGIEGVPESIVSLRTVSADVAVAIVNEAGDTVVVRALRGDRGWVLLSLDGGDVVHRPLTRSALEEDLTFILAGMASGQEAGA